MNAEARKNEMVDSKELEWGFEARLIGGREIIHIWFYLLNGLAAGYNIVGWS